MATGSLQAAIDEAMRMTWDQSIGYTWGGDGNPDSNGYDCSAFVLRSLYRAGFNVPAHRVGTKDMKPVLQSAGFNIIPATSQNPAVEPGDIVVFTHYTDLAHINADRGHTFFYMENVLAYTDPNAYSANTGIVNKVKIEASSSRGHTASGDSKRNGNGAYWEVWTHAYAGDLIYADPNDGYPVNDPYVDAYVAHWPSGLNPIEKLFGAMLLLLFLPKNKKRRFYL